MQSVKILLEQTGACMEDIAKVTTYVTDREALASVSPVLGRHLRGVDPTSTTVVWKRSQTLSWMSRSTCSPPSPRPVTRAP